MACGRLLRPPTPLPERPAPAGRSPMAALRSAIVDDLAEPPCYVSFSGGRDSSAVLATAVDAARREGLPLPVPVSARFRDAPQTQESAWQERVVSHLGLGDWVRLEVEPGELDVLGPRARHVLERYGLLVPGNTVFVTATLEAAAGGCLLTGIGGDDLFQEWRWRELADALVGRRRVNRYDLLDAGYQFLPRRLRAALDRRYLKPPPPPWLRAEARRQTIAAIAAERLDEPLTWPAWLRWCAGRVHIPALGAAFDALARDAGARVRHPLLDPGFIAALGRAGGPTGFGDRSRVMLDVFGDVLPADVCTRPDKAQFAEVYWSRHAREFIADWDGSGVDTSLVDVDVLRAELRAPLPDPRCWLLVQSAWLHSARPSRLTA